MTENIILIKSWDVPNIVKYKEFSLSLLNIVKKKVRMIYWSLVNSFNFHNILGKIIILARLDREVDSGKVIFGVAY